METELVVAEEYGIEEQKANDLTKGLNPILKERDLLIEAFNDVSQLEVNEENIPEFKALRLKIQKNRTQGINKWHKASKEFFLSGGRFVDAIKNKENQVNEEMESKLLDSEKYFENLEKERINKLQLERAAQLGKYVEDISHINLGEMDEDIWDAYFNAKKAEYEKRIEEEKKAEEARIEKERLDKLENDRRFELAPYAMFVSESNMKLREMSDDEYSTLLKSLVEAKNEYDKEQEEIRLENERLKKERETADAKRKAEEKKREAEAEKQRKIQAKKEAEHQAQLKKEREAREKLEREERERKEAEAKEEQARKLEAEKLAKAPVKEKLNKWVNDFDLPETSVNNKVSRDISEKFEAFKKWSINQVNNL